MASINGSLLEHQASSYELDCLFKCDFCPSTFRSEDVFNVHVLEHFDRKNCAKCNKFVIRLGTKWFEVHIDEFDDLVDRNDFDDQKNNLILTSEVKVENCDESDNSNKLGDINVESMNVNDFEDENSMNELDGYTSEVEGSKSENDTKTKQVIKNDEIKQTAGAHKTESSRRRRKGRLARIKCRICDRHIIKDNFDIHLQKMHVPHIIVPAEPIKCETCGKSFASSGNLKTHQAIHSGTKRFVCSYCGTSFRQLYHLTEHMNAHTGDKPYHCTVCDKRFGRLHILRAHQRVHTGEKPHKCTIDGCHRAYAYDIDLKRHKFSAHGIYTKKHICSFCSKIFPENKLLKKHLESHSAGNIRRLLTKPDE